MSDDGVGREELALQQRRAVDGALRRTADGVHYALVAERVRAHAGRCWLYEGHAVGRGQPGAASGGEVSVGSTNRQMQQTRLLFGWSRYEYDSEDPSHVSWSMLPLFAQRPPAGGGSTTSGGRRSSVAAARSAHATAI